MFTAARAYTAVMREHFFADASVALGHLRSILRLVAPALLGLARVSSAFIDRFGLLVSAQSFFLFGPDVRVGAATAPVLAHVVAMRGSVSVLGTAGRARASVLRFHVASAPNADSVCRHNTFYSARAVTT